jgi:hypothetical protein
MSGRKAIVGLSLLCALVFCAFGAATASAAGGSTAFTCVKGAASADFEDEHCDKGKVGGGFGHVEIAPGSDVKKRQPKTQPLKTSQARR